MSCLQRYGGVFFVKRCRHPGGITIKPDGVNKLLPCLLEDKEIHRNVTVTISQCQVCGHIESSWERQDDTEDEIIGALGPEQEDDF